jgi:hypothetical protein
MPLVVFDLPGSAGRYHDRVGQRPPLLTSVVAAQVSQPGGLAEGEDRGAVHEGVVVDKPVRQLGDAVDAYDLRAAACPRRAVIQPIWLTARGPRAVGHSAAGGRQPPSGLDAHDE